MNNKKTDNEYNFELEASLKRIIKSQEEIAGLWNGKEPGAEEDNAQKALDIIDVSKQLLELMEDNG